MYSINPCFFESDSTYSSSGTFGETVSYLKTLANVTVTEENALTIEGEILIIETTKGVFIRTKDGDWCTCIMSAVNEPMEGLPALRIIQKSQWNEITQSTKYPINSMGDQRLARWKVGF